MRGVIEPASSGRAKCRGCARTIAKAELRFGERVPNPFGDGEATYWFHLRCAAMRRPEQVLEVLDDGIADHERLSATAEEGVDHDRLPRLAGVQRSPSGRARCRQCREPIAKDVWRIVLEIWEEGRFGPIGFIHAACSGAYFGTSDVVDRITYFAPQLSAAEISEVSRQIASAAVPAAKSARADGTEL